MTVTLRDVAARAGVSAITASRALNNSGYVSAATRQRIAEAAAELHYVPNAVASSLRSNKTQLLALLVADITNPFWTTVARAVEDAAMDAGYAVIFCNTDENQAKEVRYLDLLLRRRIDGMIVAPTPESTNILRSLKNRRVPFVLVDRLVEGVDADNVRGDSRGGARQLTEHLLRTGYRRIAMISGPRTVSTAEERVAGYVDAHCRLGVTYDDGIVCFGEYRESWGYEAARSFMSAPNPPDALFAANNSIALGALHALHDLGLRVPEDVALVCFDDRPYLSTSEPFLTTSVQPAVEMGRVATRLLLDRIARPELAPRSIVLPARLVVRASCGCSAAVPV